eukprot:409434-Pyramimonas_sp.AAC.1
MSNFPAAKEANKQNYKNDPMAWRASVAPFLPSAEPEVRAQAVANAKREHAEIEEHVEKQFDQELEDDMLLTKSQYIGWMLNNEASTRTRRELGKDFDRLVEEQGDKHKNRNGESRVKHEGYGTLRKGKSNEAKKGVLKVSEIDVETYSLKRRRLTTKTASTAWSVSGSSSGVLSPGPDGSLSPSPSLPTVRPSE